MEPKKLVIDEKLKLRLEEMDKILTALCPDDPEEYREVRGGGGCGAVCMITCSYYCRPVCKADCQVMCGGYAELLPGLDTCGVSMIIWYL